MKPLCLKYAEAFSQRMPPVQKSKIFSPFLFSTSLIASGRTSRKVSPSIVMAFSKVPTSAS